MKLSIFFLILCINFQNCSGNSAKKSDEEINIDSNQGMPIVEDTMLLKLKSIDFKQYIKKPIDSLFENKLVNEFKEYVYVDSKPGLLTSLLLKYSDSLYIEIFFDKFKFVQPFKIDKKWDFVQVRKETIADIKLLYKDNYIDL